ncbi:MAG: ABC transporter permease subunit [Abitibacteriaceae bacterium]|nr:ABC transporter permease subunit [Abditibacteriaceae bacterium]
MEWNPVLTREMRVRWRDGRAFVLMLAYATFFALVLGWSYRGLSSSLAHNPGWGNMMALGRQLFSALTWMQTLGWMLIAPSLTATSIAGEREQGLLEGLQLSPLVPSRIVWGKLLAACSFIALMILASLPIVATCFLLGGVSPADFMLALLLHVVTATTGAIIGLTCSAWSRRGSIALRMTFALIIMWNIGSAIAYLTTIAFRLPASTGTTATVNWRILFLHLFGYTNPILASFALVGNMPRAVPWIVASLPWAMPPWAISIIFQCALSAALLWSATRALRKPFQEQYWIEGKKIVAPPRRKARELNATVAPIRSNADNAQSPWWELPLSSLVQFSNPVLQREWRGKLRMRKAPLLVIVFESALGLIVGYYYFQALWWAFFEPSSRQTIWWVLAVIAIIVVGLSCAIMGAGAFTREREAQTWEALNLSLLSPRQIITGKLVAPLLACMIYSLPLWPLLLPCIRSTVSTGDSSQGIAFTQAIATALVFGGMAWCYTIMGMFISWRCRRMAAAVGWTLGTLFFLNVFLPIFIGFSVGSGPALDVVRWWQPLITFLYLGTRTQAGSVLFNGTLIALVFGVVGSILLGFLYRSMHVTWREREDS